MTMTKKQAIKYHIEHMHDIDLIHLIGEIYCYYGGDDDALFDDEGFFVAVPISQGLALWVYHKITTAFKDYKGGAAV